MLGAGLGACILEPDTDSNSNSRSEPSSTSGSDTSPGTGPGTGPGTDPGTDPGIDPNATALSLSLTADSSEVVPTNANNVDMSASFTARVSGFKNAADAAALTLKIAPVGGLSFRPNPGVVQGDTKTFVVIVSHDGQSALACDEASIRVELDTVPTGYRSGNGAQTTQVSMRTGATHCRIRVHQRNLEAFNRYASTAEGRSLHYQLIENVELPSPPLGQSNWTPIGGYSSAFSFTGSFDGGGHTLKNLVIHSSSGNLGLFGHISGDAVIENLGLTDVNVNGTWNLYVGGLVGEKAAGTVRNCYVTGAIASVSHYVGGLVGFNELGPVENSFASASVNSAGSHVGGLVGANRSAGTVRECYATGNVSGTSGSVGGVVGTNHGTVRDCYSTGIISGAYYVGGVVGDNNGNLSNGTLTNCYSTGHIHAHASNSADVGGIVGHENYSHTSGIRNCVALNSSVTSVYHSGSMIGRVLGANSTTLINSYARHPMDIRHGTNTDSTGGTEKVFVLLNQATNTANRMDGTNVSANEYSALSFWTDRLCSFHLPTQSNLCWDFTNTWQWGPNNLPILRNVGGAQNHRVQP